MSTIAIKFTSLAVRTLAKPIANSIKQQAKEHPRFRAICIGIAQAVHRTDMRIRLNLLRDSSVIEKAEEAEERRKSADKVKEGKESIVKQASDALKDSKNVSVKTSNTNTFDTISPSSLLAASEVDTPPTLPPKKKKPSTPHIRPLSDSKAIENGANFISEFFLFSVAGGLILFETLRNRKKEMDRRDEVADKLAALEEVDEIWRRKVEMLERRLDQAGIKRVPELPPTKLEKKDIPKPEGWLSRVTELFTKSDAASKEGTPTKPEIAPTKVQK
ncbi:hypothetical protein H072_7859 [Dactylellina haptotyla CBS 200.50]|uniref:OPA3-like protein n=1 Tax=Dactylellina haptotyla (strain CBS 200.50) TaxID=1284197 RepID=S8ABD8_DACHA|nr:hypothetical protein H072_7859 [Dactylellina haptotyla CBS 200.50]